MKKIKDIQQWIDGYKEVEDAVDELELAFDYVKEGEMSDISSGTRWNGGAK